jgi:O-antigen/teichoic acid export membrane protein
MIAEETEDESLYQDGKIVRDATALSGTLYLSQGIYIIRGFIIARFLGPSVYGVWSIFRSFLGSASFLGLGTQQAMRREVPFSIGEGNKRRKALIIQSSLSWNVLITSIVMVIVFLLSFTKAANQFATEVRLAGILFVLNAVHIFMRPKFNSEQKILLLSKYIMAYAILNTLFGLSFLYFFKLKGLLLGMIIAQFILLTYLVVNNHLSLKLSIDKNLLFELFSIGFPIMIFSFIVFLMGNVDKYMVFAMLGRKMTGYYGLAAFASSAVGYISYSMTNVVFPRMMYTYAKTGEIKDIEKYYIKPMFVLSGIIPIILCIIYINVKLILVYLLPSYLPGITVVRILIISLFFSTILGLPTNLLIALNKQKKFAIIMAIVLFLDVCIIFLAIKNGFGIKGVAFSTTFFFALASTLANIYALFLLKYKIRKISRKILSIYWPFIYSFASMFLIISVSISNNVIIDHIIKSLVFLLLAFPLFIYIEKNSMIARKVFGLLHKFKNRR